MAEKGKRLFFNEDSGLRDFLFIPLFFSLYLVYHFFQNTGFQLELFDGRSISVATSEGIDIAKRVSAFYKAIFAFVLLAPVFTYIIQRFWEIISPADWQLLNASAASGFILLFFQLLGADMQPSLHLILAFQLVVIAGIGLKLIWKFDDSEKIYTALIVWIFSLSFSLYFLQLQLLSLAGKTGTPSLPVFLSVFSFSLLFFYFRIQRIKPLSAAWLLKTISVSAPLAFIPLLSVLATELYFILNQHEIYTLPGSTLYFSLLLILFIWTIYRNRKWKKSVLVQDKGLFNALGKSWLPILVGAIATLATYTPIVSPVVDWFEDANRILPMQQFFDFGKIPFLDTFSSHAFSDFGPGILFSLLNGYNPLGGFVYQFIIPVLISLLIYFFLFRITNNGLIAFFIAILYPYSDFILPSYYNFIPLTILALLNIYRKQSVGNYFLYFLILILMIGWRIDLGAANLLAGLGGILLLTFAVPDFHPDYKKLLKGFGMLILLTLLLFLSVLILWHGNIFQRISEALGYMSSLQSYGVKDLSGVKDMKYYSLYFVLPLAVLLAAAHAFVRMIREKGRNKETIALALSILFLSIFYFANFQRGLVRHTLAEQWDTAFTSYGFFILGISAFFNQRFRKEKTMLFFLFTMIASLLVVNYKFNSPELTRNNMYSFAKANLKQAIFPLPSSAKINRTPESADVANNYRELDEFFKSNFADSSTFLDFSNTPMLYYYLHRITPNYLCQIPHTAHNDKMQMDLLEGLQAYDIPVVIFSNVPNTFWDYLDGIPNTLRHYKISEYIYRNYKPYAILNKHAIWLRKNSRLQEPVSYPVNETNKLSMMEIHGASLRDSIIFEGRPDEMLRLKNIISSPLALSDTLHYYMSMSMISGTQGTLSLISTYSGKQGTESRKTELRISNGYSEPFIILDQKPGEEFLQALEVQLPGATTYSISSIQIYKCKYLPELFTSQAREHSLKLIPYVWGNFDKSKENENTGIKVLSQNYTQKADAEIRFILPMIGNKEEGNYIRLKARIRGEKPADVILNYGSKNEKLGSIIFTVKNSSEMKEYKIRVSEQYNWSRRETEWLSLYPIGADLELEMIDIEKGD